MDSLQTRFSYYKETWRSNQPCLITLFLFSTITNKDGKTNLVSLHLSFAFSVTFRDSNIHKKYVKKEVERQPDSLVFYTDASRMYLKGQGVQESLTIFQTEVYAILSVARGNRAKYRH